MKKLFLIFCCHICLCLSASAQSFNPTLANKLQNIIDSVKTARNLKGISACVIYPGMGTWKGVTGFSHSGIPINSNMEFGIGSNTKLFTGVLLLKLAENNLIQLDDSLHEYLPPYNNINPNITIRQLLNHTSGLYDVTNVPGYPDSILSNPNRIFTAAEMMTWMQAPLFAPGTDWSYCNSNYLLAGMIAERVTGRSYVQLLHDSILTPLHLDSTFLDVYDNILFPVAHPWQAGTDNNSIPRKSLNSAAWTAGAMYSTSGEMTQWYQALMNGQVINSNSLNEMTKFVGSGSYGIGISRAIISGRTVWQHGGTIWGGYNSSMMYDSASGVIVGVLINQLPAQAYQISAQLLTTIADYPLDTNNNDITIYPNPSNNYVQIDATSYTLKNIRVFNAKGQLLLESNESTFSTKQLSAGTYFLRILTDKGTIVKKLIKQ